MAQNALHLRGAPLRRVPRAVYYMREPLKLDDLWAGLRILGAVHFMFRDITIPHKGLAWPLI